MPSRAQAPAKERPAAEPAAARAEARGPEVEAVPAGPRDVLRLQRTLGNQAVARMLGVVQRAESWTQHKDKAMDPFVTKLDALVNKSAGHIVASPLGVPDTDGYLKRWMGLVASFAKSWKDSGGKLEVALAEEPFVFASYGYAVESMTNAVLESQLGGDLPKGHKIALQASRGHTRPDIVVKNGEGEDVGWFDITASVSETHIDKKTGSGWTTRPYVAEVTYPSLTTSTLETICANTLKNDVSSEEMEKLKEMAKANKSVREKQYTKTAGLVALAIKSVDDKSDMAKRRRAFEETLWWLMTGDDSDKLSPAAAKGLIAEVWRLRWDSYSKAAGDAGYKGAHAKGARAEQARELIYNLSVG